MASLMLVLAVPLVAGVVALHGQRWHPVLDLAMTEMRVRDVGTAHSPLVGLVGRIGPFGPNQGSHPGPLSFWALAPVYRIFGASSWALEVAAACLHLVAVGLALWIASRRGRLGLVLAVAAMIAVLLHFYGPATLTQAWNPYLPVLWWLVFLLACWSILCDDFVMLPVAAFAGSFCMQTHVPYVGLVSGLGAVTFAVACVRMYRSRNHGDAVGAFLRCSAVGLAVLVVVWIPPLIDQIGNPPGNLSVLWDYFRHPPQAPVGLRRGIEVLLGDVNPVRLVTVLFARSSLGSVSTTATWWPGAVLIAGWATSAAFAWRTRLRELLRLDFVIGIAVVLGVVSASQIFGLVWFYLVMWAWVISALMLLAIGWTVAALFGRRLEGKPRWTGAGSMALVGVLLVFTGLVTVDATRVKIPDAQLSTVLDKLVPPTFAALAGQSASAGAVPARYLVTWRDPVYIGAPGYGLLNELDRRGLNVGTTANNGPGATRHRVLDPGAATAVVHLAIGTDIDVWRAKGGVREVAYDDPRTAAQRAEYTRLRSQVVVEMQAAGLSELVPGVDGNLFGTAIDPRLPSRIQMQMSRLLGLGQPEAVFIGPPSTGT